MSSNDPVVLTSAQGTTLQTKKDLDTQIDNAVMKRLVKIAGWSTAIFIGLFIGWLLTTLWQMNEKIHTIVGQEMVHQEIQSLLTKKVDFLEKENAALRSKVQEYEAAQAPKGDAK